MDPVHAQLQHQTNAAQTVLTSTDKAPKPENPKTHSYSTKTRENQRCTVTAQNPGKLELYRYSTKPGTSIDTQIHTAPNPGHRKTHRYGTKLGKSRDAQLQL